MPAVAKAQTTKQARAAYKARGRPCLSEKEQRQLERAIQLDERAEKTREAEKRRVEAARRRAEKETQERAQQGRNALGSQRRFDRYGFIASQYHLGAFFGNPKPKTSAAEHGIDAVAEEDEFDEGIDDSMFDDLADEALGDEELLLALDKTPTALLKCQRAGVNENTISDAALMHPPVSLTPALSTPAIFNQQAKHVPTITHAATHVPAPTASMADLDSLWDELGSSTQIARELDASDSDDTQIVVPKACADSFGSADFDLTAEDLAELDPPEPAPIPQTNVTPPLPMGPPPLPVPRASTTAFDRRPNQPTTGGERRMDTQQAVKRLDAEYQQPVRPMLPPLLRPSNVTSLRVPAQPSKNAERPVKTTRPQKAIRGPFMPASTLYCSPDLGFTLTQLEGFVEDDLQLTQAVPG